MTAEDRCDGCDRVCACACGCQAHSHYRHCLACIEGRAPGDHRDRVPLAVPPAYRLGRHRARKPFGRCYELAWKYMVDHPIEGLELVHGTVGPTPDMVARGIVVAAGHAWVEIPELDVVFDPSYQVFFDRDDYYRGWKVRAIVRSTRQEAGDRLLEHRHPGPWHGEPLYHDPPPGRALVALMGMGRFGLAR